MRQYITRDQLALMVAASQLVGTPTAELVQVVRQMARGLVDRFRYTLDVEDVQQAAVVILYTALPKLDVKLNCFSYLTSCVHNELKGLWAAEARQQELREQLARDQGWRPTPCTSSC